MIDDAGTQGSVSLQEMALCLYAPFCSCFISIAPQRTRPVLECPYARSRISFVRDAGHKESLADSRVTAAQGYSTRRVLSLGQSQTTTDPAKHTVGSAQVTARANEFSSCSSTHQMDYCAEVPQTDVLGQSRQDWK